MSDLEASARPDFRKKASVIYHKSWIEKWNQDQMINALVTFAREVEAETLERAARVVETTASDLSEIYAADIDSIPSQYHGQASKMILSVHAMQSRTAKTIRALKAPSNGYKPLPVVQKSRMVP